MIAWPYRPEFLAMIHHRNYFQQLLEDVKSDTSGNFYRVFQSLLQPPELNDAQDLHHAMKVLLSRVSLWTFVIHYLLQGLGTDEDTIQEILFTRTNLELHAIDKVYFDCTRILVFLLA